MNVKIEKNLKLQDLTSFPIVYLSTFIFTSRCGNVKSLNANNRLLYLLLEKTVSRNRWDVNGDKYIDVNYI